MLIEDGTGKGFQAGVDEDNRLKTFSVTTTAFHSQTEQGLGFNAPTDLLTLTNAATENGIIYIKNDDPTLVLTFEYVAWCLGKATTSGDVLLKMYANPTGGTLLSAGTSVTMVNRHFGSRNAPSVTIKKMASVGQTVTGGTLMTTRIFQDATQGNIQDLGWHIPTGTSVAITVSAPTSNTSMGVSLTPCFYFEDHHDH